MLDDLYQTPVFHLTQWAAFLNAYDVTDLADVLFIMRLEAVRLLIGAFIDTMLLQCFYDDDYGFIHFIAYHAPNFLLATTAFPGRVLRGGSTLLCHSSLSNCVRRCCRRAVSLRVCAKTRLFFTSPRCCCKRRLNNFKRRSLISRMASSAVYSATCLRRSLSFDTFCLPSCNKAGCNRQLMTCQAYCFFSDFFTDAANFEDNTTRLNNCYPVIDSTFTATHTGFGRFGSNGLIWKDTDPHFATTLHKAGERDTCCLDLTGLHPAWFQSLQ